MMRIFDKQIYRTDIRIRSMELKHGIKENMRERERERAVKHLMLLQRTKMIYKL